MAEYRAQLSSSVSMVMISFILGVLEIGVLEYWYISVLEIGVLVYQSALAVSVVGGCEDCHRL